MSTREAFLEQVRQAVRTGNRPGIASKIEPRGRTGYQGSGPDPAGRFCEQFAAAGGVPHLVHDPDAAIKKVIELTSGRGHLRILLGRGGFIDALGLDDHLRAAGNEVFSRPASSTDGVRDQFFAADLSVTGVDFLVAETGSVVYLARASEPRSLSLLPPVHIAVASADQIVPDLFDLVELADLKTDGRLPSCISLITGPSKTGDIELNLVTGVHGPGEIHVVLLSK